jgi:replication factor C subunit 3/5
MCVAVGLQIMDALDNVCKREGLQLPKQLAAKIAASSKGNMRRAILMLESSKVQRCVSVSC